MNEVSEPYWKSIEARKEAVLASDRERESTEMSQFSCGEPVKVVKQDMHKFIGSVCFASAGGICAVCLGVFGIWWAAAAVLFIAVGGGILYGSAVLRHRTKVVKYSMVREIVTSYFAPEVYLAGRDVSDDVLDEADIVPLWDSASMSDYFSGNWKGTHFQFGDISIFLKNGHKKECIFSGQLFILETGLELKTGITIHERSEPLSDEIYAGVKNSDRFFLTGNQQFDRQFDVHLGKSDSVNGFEQHRDGVSPEEQRKCAHRILDSIAQDIIEADSYAVSRTRMRFIGNRLYLAIENSRDTFELRKGDELRMDELHARFDEEVRDMTLYLDLVTKSLERLKREENAENSEVCSDKD